MESEIDEDGCKNCCVLQNEIQKKSIQMEQNNSQQLAGFLTLKQKIIATDKLIREYQSSKVECDILTRKNEEFARLIDQLHRDLNNRNQEYSTLYGDIEPLRKVNAEYEVRIKELHDEAQKWKSEAEAGKNFTAQLVEKVKVLEKYEEEVKSIATKSKECERIENKLEALKGQCKDAKETAIKLRKECNKMQKDNKQLIRYAKIWGKIVEDHGKFNVLQKKFYQKLCSGEMTGDNDGDEDADLETVEKNVTDEQSKLLEQLLDDGGGSDVEIPTPDILSDDTEIPKKSWSTPVKSRLVPSKSSPSRPTEQTSPLVRKRGGQDNLSPSKTKTPTRTPVTRKRSRTASQTSGHSLSEFSSDTDVTTESEKENGKRIGPHTRSRSIKAPVRLDLKGPDPIPSTVVTPKSCEKTVAKSTSPKLVVNAESLSSSESDTELDPSNKSMTIEPKTVVGIKPLVSLFEPDLNTNPSQQQAAKDKGNESMDKEAQPCLANMSSMFGFISDDSSESVDEVKTVCKSPIILLNNEPSNSTNPGPTTFAGIFDKSTNNSENSTVAAEQSIAEEFPGRSEPEIDQESSSIFTLEADLNISSEMGSVVCRSNEISMMEDSVTETVIEARVSSNPESSSNIAASVDLAVSGSMGQDAVLDSVPAAKEVGVPKSMTNTKESETMDVDKVAETGSGTEELAVECQSEIEKADKPSETVALTSSAVLVALPTTEEVGQVEEKILTIDEVAVKKQCEKEDEIVNVDKPVTVQLTLGDEEQKSTEDSQESGPPADVGKMDISIVVSQVDEQQNEALSEEHSIESSSVSVEVPVEDNQVAEPFITAATEEIVSPLQDQGPKSSLVHQPEEKQEVVPSPIDEVSEKTPPNETQAVMEEVVSDTLSGTNENEPSNQELVSHEVIQQDNVQSLPVSQLPPGAEQLEKKEEENQVVLLPVEEELKKTVHSDFEDEQNDEVKFVKSPTESLPVQTELAKSTEEPTLSQETNPAEELKPSEEPKLVEENLEQAVVNPINNSERQLIVGTFIQVEEPQTRCVEESSSKILHDEACDLKVAKEMKTSSQLEVSKLSCDDVLIDKEPNSVIQEPEQVADEKMEQEKPIEEVVSISNSMEIAQNQTLTSLVEAKKPENIPLSKEVTLPTSADVNKQLISVQIVSAVQQLSSFAKPIPEKSWRPGGSQSAENIKQNAHPLVNPEPLAVQRSSSFLESPRLPQVSLPQSDPQPSAFKVPRIPDVSRDLSQAYPWSRGVKRSSADDEVAVILKQIRSNIIDIPLTVSPLPTSPKPNIQVKVEEPKCIFPVLPRCAFNWTAKKLPISDQLTEHFGAYLHPGVQVRVRFRRLSKRLRDLWSPDHLGHCLQGVRNFAEAERRPKPIARPVPFLDPFGDMVDTKAKETPTESSVSVPKSSSKPEKRPKFALLSSSPPIQDVNALAVEPVSKPQSSVDIAESTKYIESIPKSSSKTLVRVRDKIPVNQSKSDGLFGSSSESETESETEVQLPNVSDRPMRSTGRYSIQDRPQEVVNEPQRIPPHSARAKLLAQPLPVIQLGRSNQPDPFKPTETRREMESPTLNRLGMANRKKSLIAAPSEALLSIAIRPKSTTRVAAPPTKRPVKEPAVKNTTLVIPDDIAPLDGNSTKKRVSHALKRGLESDGGAANIASLSKRGRTQLETMSSSSVQTPLQEKVSPVAKIPTRDIVNLKAAVPSKKNQIKENVIRSSARGRAKLSAETIDTSESESDTNSEQELCINVATKDGMDKTLSSEEEKRCEQKLPVTKSTEKLYTSSAKIVDTPQSPEKESPRSPDAKESPLPPDNEESPQSPDIGESPQSPDIEIPQSPIDQRLHSSIDDKSISSTQETPASPVKTSQENPSSAFEFVSKLLLQKDPPVKYVSKKLKNEVKKYVNKAVKAQELTKDLLDKTVERILRTDSLLNPSVFIRQLIGLVIHCWEDPMDLSMTPPAPPLAVVQQRSVVLLKHLDEEYLKKAVEPVGNEHLFSDYFLSDVSSIMFQPGSTLTLEEMCSLARAYTAVCRSRGSLGRTRSFLYDCLYFLPSRSYALTYTIITVWAEVLRQPTFPLGLSCIDQTIAYLLLFCNKVSAVPGIAGKVLQVRSFLQNTYGYKHATSNTIDDLVNFLLTSLNETNSVDEASSLSWSLALLARWEGTDFAINVIEKHLWPFLRRWGAGEGTTTGAAAAIVAMGMLGKTVPANKRTGVKSVLSAMKHILVSDEVAPSIQEAAIEAVLLLGESEDPKQVVEVLKAWKIVDSNISVHLQQILKAFFKRHSDLVV